MIKAIVDTNVLISGIISTKSSPAKIIDLWHERKFILVTSKKILQEVERVLNYPKITKKYHLNKEKITDFLKGLSTFSEVCSPRKKILIIKKDLEDNKFIEAAVVTRADFIISGDRHLLELGEYQGTEIITAKEFLLRIQVYL